jgi:cytosine/adenosine deaminase-related metal-dependent hydrolase
VSNASFVAGHVLSGGRFFFGHVEIEDGSVAAVREGPPPQEPLATGLVVPGLWNSHTHVGDAAVPPPPEGLGPSEVFAPPGGYKHRMLRETPGTDLRRGIARFLDDMTAGGTVQHTDFREGGVEGVELLAAARGDADHPPRSRVFGRPARQEFDPREMGTLMAVVDGIGLSAAMDWPRGPMVDVATAARDMGLPVALHCSETRREDLSPVLELGPEFLVHMVHGTGEDFRDLAAARVPVVVCPRSTSRYTRAPPVVEMIRAGVDLRVGTDNAMLQGPSVLDELVHLRSDRGVREALGPLEMLAWATAPAKGSNTNRDIGVSAGSSDLAVLTFRGSEPLTFLDGPTAPGAELVMTRGRIWSR